jgi:phospholipid/cholesterol/gamma-HCH transport system substrate-binding protein
MSLSRAQQARLGVFMVAGIVILALFVVIPLGLKFTDKYKSYVAYFKGESLSGLEQGSTIKFNGVPIGKVDKISYLLNDLARVRVILKIQDDFPMKKDMVATTGAMGITGLKYIEITGGTNESELLKPGAEIPTKISLMSTITGKAEVIVAKVELLLNHLNEISNPDSLRRIKEIVDNIATITSDVKGFVQESRPQIRTMASSTNNIIFKVDSIATEMKTFTRSINSIQVARIGSIIGKVDSTTLALKILSENLSLMIRQTREDFTVGMQNVREASENANRLTRTLAENPSLLLKGEAQRERTIR